jgi:hypothetical protein
MRVAVIGPKLNRAPEIITIADMRLQPIVDAKRPLDENSACVLATSKPSVPATDTMRHRPVSDGEAAPEEAAANKANRKTATAQRRIVDLTLKNRIEPQRAFRKSWQALAECALDT